MTCRAKRNQVLVSVLFGVGPRNNVRNLDRVRAAGRDGAAVTSLQENPSFQGLRYVWSSIWHAQNDTDSCLISRCPLACHAAKAYESTHDYARTQHALFGRIGRQLTQPGCVGSGLRRKAARSGGSTIPSCSWTCAGIRAHPAGIPPVRCRGGVRPRPGATVR
jgi:hypothetical protein